MTRTAFILTALECECDAVLAHLPEHEEEEHPEVGTVYWVGRFGGWRVAVAEIGAGNANAALEAERAFNHFSPELALFVGVAGGIKDLALGDVAVGTKVYGYHSGKAIEDFQPRPDLGECAYRLTQKARTLRRTRAWLDRIKHDQGEGPVPRVQVGPIAAGEQVVASTRGATYTFLRQHYGDAIAVEMEGRGFLSAAFAHKRIDAAVIRGISDLIDKKSKADEGGSQPRASAHAAAFAFELLARLDGTAREPEWGDEATRDLSTRLDTKLRERDELAGLGADTTEIEEIILGLKREIRKGPERQAGDFVADRYRLIRKIGGGGFATVWEAYDRVDDRSVALKLLHGRFATNRDRRDRLFRGARQMAKLDHPHIVRVLDEPGTEDGWAFFTMELLEGDFRAAVTAGRLTLDQRLDVLDQVASALDFAHSRQVVHRDVKPGNILLTRDGTAKLSDFDLVKATGTTGATRTRQGMGSYHYAAPETMLDASQAGPACDTYGLAVTALFALLGSDPGGLFMGYRDRYFETVDLPVGVREVLHRAMDHDPGRRHASPSEFCRALRQALTEHEAEPKAEGPGRTIYDVFLSHASADKPEVEILARRLRQDGLEPFLDKWHLVPGEPWQEALEHALEVSRTCAVFLGADLGPWQNEEMRDALDERTRHPDFRVIPVLLPGARNPSSERLPRFLRRLTWVDFRRGLDSEEDYHRLICGIRGVPPNAGGVSRPELSDQRPQATAASRTPDSASRAGSARDKPSADDKDLPQHLERLVEGKDRQAIFELAERSIGTQNLDEIFFLDWALRQIGAGDHVAKLYDALPDPSEPGLFRWAETKDGRVDLWRTIPAGEGWIGSPEDEKDRQDWEGPRHRVTLTRPFALAAVPVTRAQWAQLEPEKADPERSNHPVVDVTWWQAMTFCRWLEHKLGLAGARLPSEEEWEYACRAGSETRYWSGDTAADLDRVGWYGGISEGLQPVGRKEANPWGLYDVHGNVWEWTQTAWDTERYRDRSPTEPFPVDPAEVPADLAAPRAVRAVRGGSYWYAAGRARSACRNGWSPEVVIGNLGFRVLLPSPERS